MSGLIVKYLQNGKDEMPVTTEINGKLVTLEDDERQVCEVWTRVMGYYRPISEFNIGKKEEARDRVPFKITGKHTDPDPANIFSILSNPLEVAVELCGTCPSQNTMICKTCMPEIQKVG